MAYLHKLIFRFYTIFIFQKIFYPSMKFLIFIIYFSISFFSLYKYVTSEKIIYKDNQITIIEENVEENNTHTSKASIGYWTTYEKHPKFIYY